MVYNHPFNWVTNSPIDKPPSPGHFQNLALVHALGMSVVLAKPIPEGLIRNDDDTLEREQ